MIIIEVAWNVVFKSQSGELSFCVLYALQVIVYCCNSVVKSSETFCYFVAEN